MGGQLLNRTVVFMAFFVLLSGCVKSEFDDLSVFVDQVKAKPPSAISPLPVVKPYKSYVYVAEGQRDPFQKEDGLQHSSEAVRVEGPGPDLDREKEALEAYPLDTLRMVGTLSKDDESWGLVKASDGVIHRVKPGHYLGQSFGRIMNVQEQQINLNEWVATTDGRWIEREASLALTE